MPRPFWSLASRDGGGDVRALPDAHFWSGPTGSPATSERRPATTEVRFRTEERVGPDTDARAGCGMIVHLQAGAQVGWPSTT